jgi:hypothetical protein
MDMDPSFRIERVDQEEKVVEFIGKMTSKKCNVLGDEPDASPVFIGHNS